MSRLLAFSIYSIILLNLVNASSREMFNQAKQLIDAKDFAAAYDKLSKLRESETQGEVAELEIEETLQIVTAKLDKWQESMNHCSKALTLAINPADKKRLEMVKKILEVQYKKANAVKDGDADRMFEAGKKLLEEAKYGDAFKTLKAAWELFNKSKEAKMPTLVEEAVIVSYIIKSAVKLKKYDEAIEYTSVAVSRADFKQHASHFADQMDFILKLNESAFLEKEMNELHSYSKPQRTEISKRLAGLNKYNLCREEHSQNIKQRLAEDPSLYCRVDNRNRHPMLIFSPLKEEILHLDPFVFLIHDVIQERDIEQLKHIARSMLRTAGLADTSKDLYFNYLIRRSENAWVYASKFVRLTQRIEAITGLNAYKDGSEPYQVGRYEIGGHYAEHVDYYPVPDPDLGNRIATLLIYFNEVEEGGGTIFPRLKIFSEAKKGAGLFWFNVHRNETVDARTKHAGCPILRGEKWVANLWFRFRGQMLHRPCGQTIETPYFLDDFNIPDWMKWAPYAKRIEDRTGIKVDGAAS